MNIGNYKVSMSADVNEGQSTEPMVTIHILVSYPLSSKNFFLGFGAETIGHPATLTEINTEQRDDKCYLTCSLLSPVEHTKFNAAKAFINVVQYCKELVKEEKSAVEIADSISSLKICWSSESDLSDIISSATSLDLLLNDLTIEEVVILLKQVK
jgi:hypothetical protein